MLNVTLICVGKLKEKFYSDAVAEYSKRLSAFCRLNIIELAEEKLSQNPSQAEIASGLEAEMSRMNIPPRAVLIALCIEGDEMSSETLAAKLSGYANTGFSHLVFVIGGSNGLSQKLKDRAKLRLSMSPMTFPHHLARVMLLEQIYRAFSISAGTKYHK